MPRDSFLAYIACEHAAYSSVICSMFYCIGRESEGTQAEKTAHTINITYWRWKRFGRQQQKTTLERLSYSPVTPLSSE